MTGSPPHSPQSLVGQVALVTGAARGLGWEIAHQLAMLGAEVIVGARDKEKADEAAGRIVGRGGVAVGLKLDVVNEADRRDAASFLDAAYGRLDILVNNAAVYLDSPDAATPAFKLASETPEHLLRTTFDANFFAPIQLTQQVLPLMRRSEAGRIVNLSSVRGSLTLQADPTSPVYPNKALAYDVSKTALNAFSLQLADELRDTPIKVNAIHPGWVRTQMGSEHADLSLEDGAKTAVMYATLPRDGPTGGFFYLDQKLPW